MKEGDKGTWYKGTANAIYQNIGFIQLYDPDYVLILSGDHIYKMDYEKMLEHHKAMDAACTISVMEVPMEEASRFGIMNVDVYKRQWAGITACPAALRRRAEKQKGRPIGPPLILFLFPVLVKEILQGIGFRRCFTHGGAERLQRVLLGTGEAGGHLDLDGDVLIAAPAAVETGDAFPAQPEGGARLGPLGHGILHRAVDGGDCLLYTSRCV